MYESFSPAYSVISFIVCIILIVANWKIFTKAGKPGWAILVPIYNIIVMVQIIDKPLWWVVMLFIPIVNVVFGIMIIYNLCLKFGQPGWHVIPAILIGFIYYPYLAFSKASYQG